MDSRHQPAGNTIMIATPASRCLSDQDLRDFSSGRLPDQRFEGLLSHLDSCEYCQSRVESSEGHADSFIRILGQRDSGEHDPVLAEIDCQAALFHAASRSPKPLDRVLPPIESLGPYRLIRPLGRGGMGAVYLAEHERLRRKCAVKLLPKERGLDADWLRRFEREMQAVASLEHPNLIAATDAGDVGGWHFLVMEYLDGLDLAGVVRRLGPMPIESAAAIMRDVCSALSALHDAGFVHRDVKPSNVMLTRDGKVKLLDLGLVLDGQSAADMRLTTVGHVLGTLAFAAPEQLSNRTTVDARADLYGVGATLFQLITGEPSHQTNHGIGPLVIEKTGQPARTMQSVRPDIPGELNSLVAKLLERDPANRLQRAIDVAKELEPFAKSASLKSLVRRALRAGEHEEATTEAASIVYASEKPPVDSGSNLRNWLLGGFAAFVLGAIVLYVQTDRGTLVIESPRDDVQVEILQGDDSVQSLAVATGKTQTTLRSGRYTVRLSSESDGIRLSDESIAIMRGDEVVVTVREQESKSDTIASSGTTETAPKTNLFKGESLSHWVHLISVERDTSTLGDAMDAIANLADAEDVDAAHAILVTARRFGGWTAGTDDSSGEFMSRFNAPFAKLLPSPGIEAITRELPISNKNSLAACSWMLLNFDHAPGNNDSLIEWVRSPGNRERANELHLEIVKVMQSSDVQDFRSTSALRDVSLSLAIELDSSLEDEPGLVESFNTFAKAHSDANGQTCAQRLASLKKLLADPQHRLLIEYVSHFSPSKTVAAIKLGIEMDASLAVPSLLGLGRSYTMDFRYRDQRNDHFERMLGAEPVTYSDEALLWLASTGPTGSGGVDTTLLLVANETLWKSVLTQVVEHTSDPEFALNLLSRVNPPKDSTTSTSRPMNGIGGGFGLGLGVGGGPITATAELFEVVEKSLAIAKQRMAGARRKWTKEQLREIQLPKTTTLNYQAESPDGLRIAFTGHTVNADKKTTSGLFVFDRATTDVTQFIESDLKTSPAWSPDSKYIAIGNATGFAASYPLVIVDVESGKIDETQIDGVGASWSPDGRYVAVSTEFLKGDTWMEGVPFDGRIGIWDTKERVLTHVSPPGRHHFDTESKRVFVSGGVQPVFSPDGNWIAWRQVSNERSFESNNMTNHSSVWFAWRDGSGLMQAFEKAEKLAWSEDGQSLVNLDTDERFEVPGPDIPRSKEIPDTWPGLKKSTIGVDR